MQSRTTTRRRTRGFTLVELLTSVAVFAIGATGVVALQKATIAGNAFGGEITTANNIGQSWLDVLSMDAQQWGTQDMAPPSTTYWLSYATERNGQWFVPDHRPEMEMGAAFDALGQPTIDGDPKSARYCVQIRTRWLCQPLTEACGGMQNVGNGLLGADVRVFWPRLQPQMAPLTSFCVPGAAPNLQDYHIIGLSTSLKQAATR